MRGGPWSTYLSCGSLLRLNDMNLVSIADQYMRETQDQGQFLAVLGLKLVLSWSQAGSGCRDQAGGPQS